MDKQNKIAVGILGATGSVGQKFIQLLANHPWFKVTALAASERSAGKKYIDAVNWFMQEPIPKAIADLKVQECKPNLNCRIVFSGLDAGVAGEIEQDFAKAGYVVLSNARNHRMHDTVPLLIPEINPDHLELIKSQAFGKGCIVTNPNCSTIGLALALKPLYDEFGLEAVQVSTMQALSGAGYPGVPANDILDNVIPFIRKEEEKMETEPLKILAKLNNRKLDFAKIKISAQCNRVAVSDGHTESVSVKLEKSATLKDIIKTWQVYKALPQKLKLPSAPQPLFHYFENEFYPQPRLHRMLGSGMGIAIGRLRKCPVLDYKFTALVHNTIRGAAGGATLNAELMVKQGFVEK